MRTKQEVSYGVTTTAAVYPSRVDLVNNTIAYLLRQECGVDAWYETRAGSDYKFLWIYNTPFLFNISGTTSYVAFYGSLYGTVLDGTADYNKGLSKLFNGTTGTYSFSLVFAGNPNNGFALRFKTYNSSSISQHFTIRFMKCTNLINGLTLIVWSGQNIFASGNISTTTPTQTMLNGMNEVDLNANGMISEDSFSSTVMLYDPLLWTKSVHKTFNDGALPLVPFCVGPYRTNGIYLRPVGLSLPTAASVTTELQTEITISGRSFLLTNSDSIGTGYINMGLIETT